MDLRVCDRVLATSCVLTMCLVATADVVPVVNPGFEDITGESQVNEFTFGPFPGWDLYDPNGIADGGDGPIFYIGTLTPYEMDPVGNPGVYENFPDGAAEGIRVAIAFNFFGSGDTGEYGLVQTLDATLEANTTYTLEVEIGNIASGTAMSGQYFDLDGFPGYRVDLIAGGVVVAQDDNTLFSEIAEGAFETSVVSLTTGDDHPQLGQPLGIRLVNLNETDAEFPDSDLEVDFDDVRLDAMPVDTPCAGDLVVDGVIDVSDLLALVAAWGTASADVNGDGTTDTSDLLLLLGAWGPC